MRLVWPLALLLVAACESLPKAQRHLFGQWGGPHAGLSLEGGIGTIEYDCATGTIDTAILPGPDGSFNATGTHRPGQGGPLRVGQIFTSHRATYAGTVAGDQMTLSVRLEDGTALGPFTLTRGAQPLLTRCL